MQSQLPIPVWGSGFCRLPHQDMPVPVQILTSNSETSLVNIQIQNLNDRRRFEKWLHEKYGQPLLYHALAVSPKWIVVRDNDAEGNGIYLMRENQILSCDDVVLAQLLGFKNGIFILDKMPTKKLEHTESPCPDWIAGDKTVTILYMMPSEIITIDELNTLDCNGNWSNENTTVQFIMREYLGNTLLQLAIPEHNQTAPAPSDTVNCIAKSFVELVLHSFRRMNSTPKPLTQGKISKAECGFDDDMDVDQDSPILVEKQLDENKEPKIETQDQETQTEIELPPIRTVIEMVDKETETDAEIRPKLLNKETQTITRSSAMPEGRTKEGSTKVANTTRTGAVAGNSRDKDYGRVIDAVFGNCYVWEYDKHFQLEDIKHEQLKEGDLIAVKTHDSNVGTVKQICRTIKENEDYARVRFEDPLNDIEGLKVKHLVQYPYTEHGCDKNWIFISLKHLLGSSSAFSLFRQNSKLSLEDQINEIVFDEEKEALRVSHNIGSVINITDVKLQKKMKSLGIEGFNNSCYADSFLFAVFAFSSNLDFIQDNTNIPRTNLAIRNIIMNDVVGTLRKKYRVKWKAVQKLRNALATFHNAAYKTEMMDVEEFALTMFGDVLQLPSFMKFDNGGNDYIHQIFVTPSEDETNFLDPDFLPNVELLLEQSFRDSKIQLRETPGPLLLVKLPVSDGVPMFKRVYPNPRLSMKNLVENRHERDKIFYLRAVICLSKHHYTCFVRTQLDHETKGSWVFHDSLPENNLPFCTELKDFDFLLEAMSNPSQRHIFTDQMMIWMNRLLETCYMCVYEPEHATETHLTDLSETEL